MFEELDLGDIRDGFFRRFFAFAFSGAGIAGSMLFVGGIFYGLKIDMVKYGEYWIGCSILLVVGLIVVRLKFFRERRAGYTKEQDDEAERLKQKTHRMPNVADRKFWLIVLGFVGLVIGIGVFTNNQGFYALVPSALFITFLVWICWKVKVEYNKKIAEKGQSYFDNRAKIEQASYDAKYGKHLNRKAGKKFGIIFLILIPIYSLLVGVRLPKLDETQLIVLGLGVVSLIVCLLLWRSIKTEELTNNEKVMKKLEKKYGTKIKKKRNWKIKITFGGRRGRGGGMKYHHARGVGGGHFPNNIGHWDANRFDPVGDQRKLRGESP